MWKKTALLILAALFALTFSLCTDDSRTVPDQDAGPDADAVADGDMDADVATPPDPSKVCVDLDLPIRTFDATGPSGILRNALADDFALTLRDGGTFHFSERYSGCESYVFLTNATVNSALDDTSLWARDMGMLMINSPDNTHFFFIAARSTSDTEAELEALQTRIDADLDLMDPTEAEWWRGRMHLVAHHANDIDGWVGQLLQGQGRGGFAIDRQQRIRFMGNFADVTRYNTALESAGEWPWESNISYAANEVKHYNYEATREAYLSEGDGTIVSPWSSEVLGGTVEIDVDFPDAGAMAAFDTMEIDLTMDCPDPEGPEFGNCGAWDYISNIFLLDTDGVTWLEMARFITTYHRQGRYLVDTTPMLAYLQEGGTRRIRFVISPEWNPQQYLTRMDFRFLSRAKGYSPSTAVSLFAGGDFNSQYNVSYQPLDVPIPAGAQHVELWATITGHGADTNNCAEFCNHSHAFLVNGAEYSVSHPAAGTTTGCMPQVDHGMVPNQGGTWWYGRGGWCPGQQVEPHVFDVTADVTPGETAVIEYSGSYLGNTPPDSAGNIVMSSYLVIYE